MDYGLCETLTILTRRNALVSVRGSIRAAEAFDPWFPGIIDFFYGRPPP